MISEVIRSLPPEQKKLLYYAFEHGITQLVELEDHYFVGVYIQASDKLLILESQNNWVYGKVL